MNTSETADLAALRAENEALKARLKNAQDQLRAIYAGKVDGLVIASPEDHPKSGNDRRLLRLYVAGTSPRSLQAIANLKAACAEHSTKDYQLEIIDLCQQPDLAVDEQIVALPTLIRKLPPPLRRLVGDLSDKDRLLLILGVDDD